MFFKLIQNQMWIVRVYYYEKFKSPRRENLTEFTHNQDNTISF